MNYVYKFIEKLNINTANISVDGQFSAISPVPVECDDSSDHKPTENERKIVTSSDDDDNSTPVREHTSSNDESIRKPPPYQSSDQEEEE